MEFRIAPMIIVIFTVCFIALANPDINPWIPLKYLADFYKVLLPFGLLSLLSLGTFLRHDYYSRGFRLAFWLLQGLSCLLLVYYVVAVKAQHL